MNNNIVELKEISVSFDGEQVLDKLNLEIKDKEFITFLGPSGCGKTTTLRLIAGFLEPDEGEIFFEDKKINGVPAYKRQVNTIFQRYALFPHLNVYENIAFGLRIKKLPEKDIKAKVEEMLNYVPVKKGDVFFIPSGLVHAIGAGILLAEIQQNSNITYRVYDYNRLGKDGKPRELHVNDALNVIVNRDESEIEKIQYSNGKYSSSTLANCEYFNVSKYTISSAGFFSADPKSFNSVLCLEGEGTILCDRNTYPISKGDSYFIPASMGGYVINGNLDVIISKIN